MSSYMGHSCKKIKNSVRKFCDFLSGKGVRGICPLQADFSKFPLREFGKIEACVPTQAVLAIFVQTARREFACCTSLGECLTTHKGVTARLS